MFHKYKKRTSPVDKQLDVRVVKIQATIKQPMALIVPV